MYLMQESLKAKYQINQNLFVYCYLDIVDATADGFKAKIWIRTPGDTVIPIGTKLYLTYFKADTEAGNDAETFELYYVNVLGVEIHEGLPVQVCSPITRDFRENQRQQSRMLAKFKVQFEEIENTEFTVVNGNIHGLTLAFNPTQLLVGLVLGRKYKVTAFYQDNPFTFTGEIVHLQYDWKASRHITGIKLLDLTHKNQLALQHLLDPTFKVDYNQSALVDTDEFRIRPEL